MKQAKRLPRAERVRLAAEKFKLAPQAVEAQLDWIAEELQKRDRHDKLSGDKNSRKQVKMLRNSARKTMDYAMNDKLPAMLGALFAASDMLGMLKTMHDTCDVVLSSKLTPRRDDADGFEKRAAAHAALVLLSGQPSRRECQELTAILYGARDAAAVRAAFKAFVKEVAKALEEKNRG